GSQQSLLVRQLVAQAESLHGRSQVPVDAVEGNDKPAVLLEPVEALDVRAAAQFRGSCPADGIPDGIDVVYLLRRQREVVVLALERKHRRAAIQCGGVAIEQPGAAG